MSLKNLYGKRKMFKMELEQRKIMNGSGSLNAKNTAMPKTTAVLADEPYFAYQALMDFGQPEYSSVKSDYSHVKPEYNIEVEN